MVRSDVCRMHSPRVGPPNLRLPIGTSLLPGSSRVKVRISEGHQMRYLLWIASATVAAGAIVEISTASAADLAPRTYTKAPPPVSAIYDWTGGYVGIEGGFGWGHSDQTDPGIAPPAPPPPPPPPPPAIGDGHYSVSGGLVGGTGGYNWQAGRWVFGLEGDYSWSDIRGQSSVCGPTTVTPHLCARQRVRVNADQRLRTFRRNSVLQVAIRRRVLTLPLAL